MIPMISSFSNVSPNDIRITAAGLPTLGGPLLECRRSREHRVRQRPELEVRRRLRRRARTSHGPAALARTGHRPDLRVVGAQLAVIAAATARREHRRGRHRRRRLRPVAAHRGTRMRRSPRSTPSSTTSSTRERRSRRCRHPGQPHPAHRRPGRRRAAPHERELLRHRVHRRRPAVGHRVRRARPAARATGRHGARRPRALARTGGRPRATRRHRRPASARLLNEIAASDAVISALSPAGDGLLQLTKRGYR